MFMLMGTGLKTGVRQLLLAWFDGIVAAKKPAHYSDARLNSQADDRP
jgi:hypothetical protein